MSKKTMTKEIADLETKVLKHVRREQRQLHELRRIVASEVGLFEDRERALKLIDALLESRKAAIASTETAFAALST